MKKGKKKNVSNLVRILKWFLLVLILSFSMYCIITIYRFGSGVIEEAKAEKEWRRNRIESCYIRGIVSKIQDNRLVIQIDSYKVENSVFSASYYPEYQLILEKDKPKQLILNMKIISLSNVVIGDSAFKVMGSDSIIIGGKIFSLFEE